MVDAEITLAARTAYEAVRAYRREIGMADMLPWIDAGSMAQAAYEQAVRDSVKVKQNPPRNIEEVLIEAVTTALVKWRGAANDDSTRSSR